ncbi:MAG: hypothetical protein H2172_13345 [Opitutus sp.]|nr:hypothetical protein [Opitutus sp.]MCS6246866.1 hypothetical protein [Opitutus sp.]MCS6273411.1 hypothetical protein [Opitutus sp.]MCS6275756.1 hypothetical protein [Opitutus sp.]MCS6300852.1 hypothetical protein [Opitutus sp.]
MRTSGIDKTRPDRFGITGQSFTYRAAPEGASYNLCAFGSDGKDDGGARCAPGDRNPRNWAGPSGGY